MRAHPGEQQLIPDQLTAPAVNNSSGFLISPPASIVFLTWTAPSRGTSLAPSAANENRARSMYAGAFCKVS